MGYTSDPCCQASNQHDSYRSRWCRRSCRRGPGCQSCTTRRKRYGIDEHDPDLSAKRLQLLRETFPKVARVAVLYHGGPGGDQEELSETQTAARALRIQIQPLHVKERSQFPNGYAAMTKERAEALVILHGSFTAFHRKELVELAFKHRLPTMCASPIWSTDGGLLSYSRDRQDQFRRVAIYVDKILKGASPLICQSSNPRSSSSSSI